MKIDLQKMKFSIKDFLGKCNQIRRKLNHSKYLFKVNNMAVFLVFLFFTL